MNQITFSMPVIFVKDIEASKKFYQDIFSLEIEHDFGENIIFKDALSLWQIKRAEKIIYGSIESDRFDEKVKPIELYFESNDIGAVFNVLKVNNVAMIHELKEEIWGQRTLRFYDPDTFIIEVAEPMDSVVLRLSKSGMSDAEVAEKTQMSLEIVTKIMRP
ncbi:MAG: hypothetical protein OCD01_08390 [Fibrobacterales bacterium]